MRSRYKSFQRDEQKLSKCNYVTAARTFSVSQNKKDKERGNTTRHFETMTSSQTIEYYIITFFWIKIHIQQTQGQTRALANPNFYWFIWKWIMSTITVQKSWPMGPWCQQFPGPLRLTYKNPFVAQHATECGAMEAADWIEKTFSKRTTEQNRTVIQKSLTLLGVLERLRYCSIRRRPGQWGWSDSCRRILRRKMPQNLNL